jgi:phage terminase large subunit-like protein
MDMNNVYESEVGMRHFFLAAIEIPQLEGSTSVIAIPQLFKETLLLNRNSTITIFSGVRIFKSAT